MPKKETPGVVRQDGTRGGGHLFLKHLNIDKTAKI